MIAEIDKQDFNERQRKLYDTSIFLGKMLIAGAVFQTILFLYPDTYGIQAFFTRITAGTLNVIGMPATSEGILIFLEESSYRVTQDCLGWKSIAAFTGLMFASSDEVLDHRNFVVLGIAALLMGNLVRVVTTIYLSHANIISFEIIHGLFWKWGLTALVMALWLYWLRKRD